MLEGGGGPTIRVFSEARALPQKIVPVLKCALGIVLLFISNARQKKRHLIFYHRVLVLQVTVCGRVAISVYSEARALPQKIALKCASGIVLLFISYARQKNVT